MNPIGRMLHKVKDVYQTKLRMPQEKWKNIIRRGYYMRIILNLFGLRNWLYRMQTLVCRVLCVHGAK